MKNQSEHHFTLATKYRYSKLLSHLLAQYQGLYEKIAPEGFKNSPYYKLYDPTTSIAYKTYRERRAFEYKMNRMKHRGLDGKMVVPQIGDGNRLHTFGQIPPYYAKDLMSYEEFVKSKASVNPDVKLCAFHLYTIVLKNIFNHRPIVYDTKFGWYTCNHYDYDKFVEKVTGKMLPDYLDVFNNKKFRTIRQDYTTDLTPIYEYIYELLKAKDIDIMYSTIDEKIISGLTDALDRMSANAEADRILFTDYGERDINEAEAERQEKYAAKRNAAIPFKNPVVEAYHNVYGKLMENYPYPWE